MARNSAYEQDNELLPFVIGTSALIGVSYGSYMLMTDPDYTTNVMTKAFNKVFPVIKDEETTLQRKARELHEHLSAVDPIAKKYREEKFKLQAERSFELGQMFDPVMPSNMDGVGEVLSHVRAMTQNSNLRNFSINRVPDNITSAVNKMIGLPGASVHSIKGTTAHFGFNGEYKLNVATWNDYYKVHMSMNEGETLSVFPASVGKLMVGEDGKKFISQALTPTDYQAARLENVIEQLAILNKDLDPTRRNASRLHSLINQNYSGFYGKTREEQFKIMNDIKKTAGSEIEAGFIIGDGRFSSDQIKTILSDIGTAPTVNAHSADLISIVGAHNTVGQMYQDMVNFNISQLSPGGKFTTTSGKEVTETLDNIPETFTKANIESNNPYYRDRKYLTVGGITNQSKLTDLTYSSFPTHLLNEERQAEFLKGLSRGLEFANPELGRQTSYGRTTPLFWANEDNPHKAGFEALFNRHAITENLIVDPFISETVVLNDKILNQFFGAPKHTLHITGLGKPGASFTQAMNPETGESMGKLAHVSALVRAEDDNFVRTSFPTYYELMEHIRANGIGSVKSAKWKKPLFVGFGDMEGIVDGMQSLNILTQEGARSAVFTSTAGSQNEEQLASTFQSYLEFISNEEKGKMAFDFSGRGYGIKTSNALSKTRTSIQYPTESVIRRQKLLTGVDRNLHGGISPINSLRREALYNKIEEINEAKVQIMNRIEGFNLGGETPQSMYEKINGTVEKINDILNSFSARKEANETFKTTRREINQIKDQMYRLSRKGGNIEGWLESNGVSQWLKRNAFGNGPAVVERAKDKYNELFDTLKSLEDIQTDFIKRDPEAYTRYTALKTELSGYKQTLSNARKGEMLVERIEHLSRISGIHKINADNIREMTEHPFGGSIAWDYFKHTIPKAGTLNNSIKLGKNFTEYNTLLRSMFIGSSKLREDVSFKVDGQAFKMFSKISNIQQMMERGLVKTTPINGIEHVSLTSLYGVDEFAVGVGKTFSEGTEIGQILAATMLEAQGDRVVLDDVLSSKRSSDILTKRFRIFGNVKYETEEQKRRLGGDASDLTLESREFTEEFHGNNGYRRLVLANDQIINETEAMATGVHGNILEIGIKDLGYIPQDILKELHSKNLTDSLAIMKQVKLLRQSISPEGQAILDLEKEGIKTLGADKSKWGELLGGGFEDLMAGESRTPGVIANTMFGNKDITPEGIGVRVRLEDGRIQTRYVAPAAGYGQAQYLKKEDMIPLTAHKGAAIDLIRDAYMSSDGIAGAEALARYDRASAASLAGGAKSGIMKAGAMRISSTYAKEAPHVDMQSNKNLWKYLEKTPGLERFRRTIGSVTLVSNDEFDRFLDLELNKVVGTAENISASHINEFKELYGESNILTRHMVEGQTKEVFKKNIYDELVELTKKISDCTSGIEAGHYNLDECNRLANEIVEKGIFGKVVRFPTQGKQSWQETFMLPDFMLKGKSKAMGWYIRKMVKGDFDGDAGSLVALFNERLRAKGAEAIYGRNAKLEELMKTATGDYELPQSPLELDRLTKEGKLEPSAIDFSVTSEDTLNTAVHNVYLDTVLAGWQTKALTGSQDVRSQNIIAHIQKKARAMEGENFTEEQIQNVSDAAHVMWAEALPQEVISAKKIQRYIDSPLASVKIRQMLGNLAGGEITEESFFDTLHENDSILDGISIAAIATKASSIEATDRWASEAMPFLEEVFAGQSHLRAVDPNKLIEGYVKYFKMSREEATTKVGLFVGEITSRNKPFIYDQYPDAAKIGIGLETVIETSKDKTKAITSLSQAMNKVKSKLGKNQTITDDEAIRRAMGEMNIGKETIQSVLDGFSGMTGRGEHRAIIGWEEVRPLLKNIKPAQYIGAGILATAGITALNMLFGDGTPSSPNDLPSVNNPALKDGRYNNLQENRTINNMPNSNISSNLITSSHNSFDSVMNHLHSNFGHNYSSVSVRHDGQDPYKEHLLQYN